MPHHKSCVKRLKQDAKRKLRNVSAKSRIKTILKKAKASVAKDDKEASKALLNQAASELDRAVKKGIIHKNNAARKKGKLAKLTQ